MANVAVPDPQSAADYEDRTTKVVKSVLLEIGQILGSFKGKFAVIGGAVPWLLLDNEDMRLRRPIRGSGRRAGEGQDRRPLPTEEEGAGCFQA
jgi:hypothetical protein